MKTLIALALLFCASAAFGAQIEAEGTISIERNRVRLIAGNDVYDLRFSDSALRAFAADMEGERVAVSGVFDPRPGGTGTCPRLTIAPERIRRLDVAADTFSGQTAAVVDPDAAIEVSVDDDPDVTIVDPNAASQLPPATTLDPYYSRVDRRKADILYFNENINRQTMGPYYDRVDRRKLQNRFPRDRRRPGSSVIITPGGGTIIQNY